MKAMILFLSSLLYFVTSELWGQIHISGQQALELQAGLVDNIRLLERDNTGYFVNFSFNKYKKNYTYWKVGFNYDRKNYLVKDYKAHTARYLVEGLYNINLLKDRIGNFYFNAGAGAFIGYESINSDIKNLAPGVELQADSRFTYGISAGLEMEYFFSQRTALHFQFKERYFIKSDVANFHFCLGAGLKFLIK